ncbi:MAG: hypothetical protein KKD11_05460 [Candidatus Omnitrophica bacterium]|nr:hypothetical protein [Candidatus Omnitrophota bacterium]
MISLCRELAESDKVPLPYYFIKNVFLDIANRCEGDALPVDKAAVTESFLIPEISKLIELAEKRPSKETLFDVMNDISSMCSKL